VNEIFVDTSAWVAIADGRDPHHVESRDFQDRIVAERYRLVTTNNILLETYLLLQSKIGYLAAAYFKGKLDALVQEEVLEVISVSPEVVAEAQTMLQEYNPQIRVALADCFSYVVMGRREITEVFAFDPKFDQMGFVRHPYP
jgi:hypothetical protein